MSAYSKGKKYEEFVQGIYQAILSEDGYTNVIVEMNKTDMIGLSGLKPQIDIYWEFNIGENRYQTAIECKNFASPVPVGKVRDFHGVLADLPKLNGIFVSSNGFQEGAIRYAETHGIALKEIRESRDEDFEGRIREIHSTLHAITTNITHFEPIPTKSFMASIPKGEDVVLHFDGTNYDPLFFNQDGKPLASHVDIQNLLPSSRIAETDKKWLWRHPDAHFKATDGSLIPIEAVYVEYDVNVSSDTFVSRAKDFVRGIVKDIESGSLRFVTS
ncbi:MAG: restriction endonuclease [Litorimonas sp.]